MNPCRCLTDCRREQGIAMKLLPESVWRQVWNRKMLQVCDQCGQIEPAGGMCSRCGHFPLPSEWVNQGTRASDAQKASARAARLARIAHRASAVAMEEPQS